MTIIRIRNSARQQNIILADYGKLVSQIPKCKVHNTLFSQFILHNNHTNSTAGMINGCENALETNNGVALLS